MAGCECCDNFSMIDGGDEFKAFPGLKGDDGTTFYPHVSEDGTLSWTNNGGLPNPDPVRIEGADGKSAYEAAVEGGYTGSEEEFNATLSNIGDVEEALNSKQDAPTDAGLAGQVLGLDDDLNPVWFDQTGGGGGGTTNYNNLTNKPRINGVLLTGDKSASDLGLALATDIPTVPVQSVNGKTGAVVLTASDVGAKPSSYEAPVSSVNSKTGAVVLSASDVGALPSSTAIPTKTSDLTNDSGFITSSALPTKVSDLTNDSGFVNAAGAAAAAPVQSVNGSVGAVTVQPTITANGILKGNGTTVSAATKGTDYGAKSFTVTLSVSGWVKETGWTEYAQAVTNNNFVASGYAYIVSPASGSFADYGTAQIYADDVTTSGRMTFHCTDAPSAALTVNIVRVVSA